jgi:hypothetical protein
LLARRLGCCIQIEREALIRSRRLPQRSGVSPFPEEPRTSAELILMGGRSAQWWGAMGLCPAQRERALDIRDGLRRAHSSPSCWRVHRKGASWSIVLHHRRPSMCTAHRPSGEVRFWSFESERGCWKQQRCTVVRLRLQQQLHHDLEGLTNPVPPALPEEVRFLDLDTRT